MTFSRNAALVLAGAIALAGCSGGDEDQTSTPPASESPETPATASSAPEEQAAPPAANASHATVTVDGETWEFSPFRCAVGNEQTGSEKFSFSSDAQTSGEGDVVLQFQVNARDESGQDRLLGDGVVYDFTLYDFGSDTPTIDYSGDTTEGVTIASGTVQVDAVFTSISGESYTVTVDAVCSA